MHLLILVVELLLKLITHSLTELIQVPKWVRWLKMHRKFGEEVLLTLGTPIDFSANKVFRMKVFSPRVGAKVLLKVENATNGGN